MKSLVSPEAFVEAWQTSSSPKEVADRLGMTVGAVKQRASKMRRKRVKLKHFEANKTNGGLAYDWDKIRDLAKKLSPGPTPERKNGVYEETPNADAG